MFTDSSWTDFVFVLYSIPRVKMMVLCVYNILSGDVVMMWSEKNFPFKLRVFMVV